jgi:hypothetical protein
MILDDLKIILMKKMIKELIIFLINNNDIR